MKPLFTQPFNLAETEKKVLEFWQEEDVFKKTLASRKKRKTFIFYEGPPYANGRPGIHHVLARVIKDIILRYKSMRGYYVPRRAGWDTHGLPVEIAAEKALGFKSKREIEQFGIEKFNKTAKEQVWIYKDEWENMTRRIGYWLDLDNPYVTYESNYIESLWWSLSQIAKRKLLYKGHKVVPWCTRCGTALSSHELAQGYKEVTDNSVYVKFKLKEGQRIGKDFTVDDKTYILSWTTTPWTLPGNVALAVGDKIRYSIVRIHGTTESLIVADELISKVFEQQSVEKIQTLSGKNLVGLEYYPLFEVPALRSESSYKIYSADFVTTTDGTGVVHTAVMYGEDDYVLGKKVGLPQHHTVNEEGKFTSDVKGFEGLYVKSKTTEEKVLEYLNDRGNVLKVEPTTHEYPHCWRCGTPVLYYARTSWFIVMSKLRAKLLAENKKINWIPKHIKEGRFGEWLREVKDWNLSRERYWGAPLPIWECLECGQHEVIGSREELRKKAIQNNILFFMRHGESDNVLDELCTAKDTEHYTPHLTAKGKLQAEKTARKLRDMGKIDLVISSPLTRTRETADIVSRTVHAPVIYNGKLVDVDPGIFEAKSFDEESSYFKTHDFFQDPTPEGESRNDAKSRMWRVFKEINSQHKGKSILIVSHGDPLWLLRAALEGKTNDEIRKVSYPQVGELYTIDTRPLPLNEQGSLDLHRPYVDDITIACSACKLPMTRVKEVADVWYDSGAMPYAQEHFPFSTNKKLGNYPADLIAEGMDQTRGWFYTLLAIATALGYKAPYKNVISLGLVNDKSGQKMSKSKGNMLDPWPVFDKYGVDAIRWYFYTVNDPGEPKNFDEAEVGKSSRRVHLLAYNSAAFFSLYGKRSTKRGNSKYVLDRWIVARLNETIQEATKQLDAYHVREAAVAIEHLIDDLSRWYIRRSRRRFQPDRASVKGAAKDHQEASQTLEYVLVQLSYLLAPFCPFFAEAMYFHMSDGKSTYTSVHMKDWPKAQKKAVDENLIKNMITLREIASAALAKRAEAGIKVRQPLGKLRVKSPAFAKAMAGKEKSILRQAQDKKDHKELLEILKDEVNVKEVVFDKNLTTDMELDTQITPELRDEGILRELVRTVQDLRQKAGYKPGDKIELYIDSQENFSVHEKLLKAEVNAERVFFGRSQITDAIAQSKVADIEVWLGVKKA